MALQDWQTHLLKQHREQPEQMILLAGGTGAMDVFKAGQDIGADQENPAPTLFGVAAVYADATINVLLALNDVAGEETTKKVAAKLGVDFSGNTEAD